LFFLIILIPMTDCTCEITTTCSIFYKTQWNLLCWKYKINEFYFGTNTKSTNLQAHELVIFNQTTKIDTHEEKYFHSMIVTIHILYIYGSAK
jgi:hypothetical protein